MRLATRVIKLIFLALCVMSINGCATPSQVYWDAKVKEMCEKNGGITVYERVEISKKEHPDFKYAKNGELIIPSEKYCKENCIFFITESKDIAINLNPKVAKTESKLVRKMDNEVLAKSTNYYRIGGDVFAVDSPSSFSCSDLGSIYNKSLNHVVNVKE